MAGMSFGQMLIGFYGSISYNVVIMYCFYYMFASFSRVLPWVGCQNNWNTDLCTDLAKDCMQAGGIIVSNQTCVRLPNLSDDELDIYNVTVTDTGFNTSDYIDPFRDIRVTPSEEYWRYVDPPTS